MLTINVVHFAFPSISLIMPFQQRLYLLDTKMPTKSGTRREEVYIQELHEKGATHHNGRYEGTLLGDSWEYRYSNAHILPTRLTCLYKRVK